MKKRIIATVCLMLVLFLCACSADIPNGAEQTSQSEQPEVTTAGKEGEDTLAEEKNPSDQEDPNGGKENDGENNETKPYVVTESYLPTEIRQSAIEALEADKTASVKTFSSYSKTSIPYATKDVFTISDCKITSISFPVTKVTTADEDGNYSLTLYVVYNAYNKSNPAGLKSRPIRSYKLLVDKEEYGLEDNSFVYKWITIDTSSYGIELAANETLAYMGADDTLFPGYIHPSNNMELRRAIAEDFPQGTGYFSKVGTTDLGFWAGTDFVVDFTFERTYDSKEEYDATVAARENYDSLVSAIGNKYEGKYVSVLGDSISTFEGISNSTSYNSTIGDNVVFYNTGKLAGPEFTYWGRLINALGMNLCVNNSWSGGRAYGTPKYEYKDSTVLRATELDNDNGTPNDPSDDISPDVIFFYIGTNDVWIHDSQFGELYGLLKSAEPSDYSSVIDNWMRGVLERTENGTAIEPNVNYTKVDEAYALTLYRMKMAYPDAEIYSFGLLRPEDYTKSIIEEYNFVFEQLNDYFGNAFIDQYRESGITYNNHHSFMVEASCTHPMPWGHKIMAEMIMKAMMEKG